MTETKTPSEKPRAKRTPKSYDSILAGALKLTLKERVDLVTAINKANEKEVADLDAAAKSASALLNGTAK